MPRDLFSGTFERKAGPRRSGWTIAGSFVAHVVLLGALLVLPVMSALDSYVVQARNFVFVAPTVVMPAMPVAPPKTSTPTPSDVKPDAAPSQPSQNEVIGDARVVESGPPGPPGSLIGDGRSAILGPPGIVNVPPPPPPAVVKPQPPIRPGGNVVAPTRVYSVEPVYPQIAIVAKQQGYVILEATIDETGIVRDVKVLKSVPLLDQAAIDAVKKWRYTPTKLNGVAVPIILSVTVTFSLR